MINCPPLSYTRIAFVIGITILSSCKHLPKEKIALPNLPNTYSVDEKRESIAKWWEEFQIPELNAFMQQAIASNFTVKEAVSRLKQLESVTIKSKSALFPNLYLSADISTKSNGNYKTDSRTSSEEYVLGLASQYELDIFRKWSSLVEASGLDQQAGEKDLEIILLTLISRITENWILVTAENRILDILREQNKLNEELLRHLEFRFLNGKATALDILQQKQVLLKSQALIPLSDQRKNLLLHELMLLSGIFTTEKISVSKTDLPSIPEFPPLGIPLDLVNNRPDIQKSLLKLQAEIQRLGFAKASRFPTFKIDSSLLFPSPNLSSWLENWVTSLGVQLLAPLFDGRSRKAEVLRARASVQEKLDQYHEAIQMAVKEVEDAIVKEQTQWKYIRKQEEELDVVRQAFENAKMRYLNGSSDYLPVFNSLLSLQNLQIQLIQKKTDLLVFRIALYRSLGGSWLQETKNQVLEKEQA